MKHIAKIGILTYNTVGNPPILQNGWNGEDDRKIFVASHPRGQVWGAGSGTKHDTARVVSSAVAESFQQIETILEELDRLYVYVGDSGSEGAVQLAAQLPAHKVTFVFCSCNMATKQSTLRYAQMQDSDVVRCECGGHRTLASIATRFQQSGVMA